jgi:hypothetical protein
MRRGSLHGKGAAALGPCRKTISFALSVPKKAIDARRKKDSRILCMPSNRFVRFRLPQKASHGMHCRLCKRNRQIGFPRDGPAADIGRRVGPVVRPFLRPIDSPSAGMPVVLLEGGAGGKTD